MNLIRAIGIDPGSRYTGYGVVEGDGSLLRHVRNGIISLSGSLPLPARLGSIYQRLGVIIGETGPPAWPSRMSSLPRTSRVP